MKKHLSMMAFCCFAGLLLTGCKDKGPNVVGTWVQPKDESSFVDEQGFTLLEDGGVIGINMGYSEYKTWEVVDNQLILCGEYIGTNPHAVNDTLNIVEVNDEHLVLEQGGYEISYEKR